MTTRARDWGDAGLAIKADVDALGIAGFMGQTAHQEGPPYGCKSYVSEGKGEFKCAEPPTLSAAAHSASPGCSPAAQVARVDFGACRHG